MKLISQINGYVSTHKTQVLAVAGALGTVGGFVPPPYNAIALGLAAILTAAAGGSAAHAALAPPSK